STSSQGNCAATNDTVICNLGTLASAASATIDIAVNASGSPSNTITNTVTVTGAEHDPDATNDSATVTTMVTAADLAVTMVPSIVGPTVTYTVRVTNNGPAAATGVTPTDPLVHFPTPLPESTSSQGNCAATAARTLTCNLGTLAAASSAT